MDALERTLKELSIKRLDNLKIEVIRYSPADEQGNKKIYKQVNETLLSIIEERKPGECIHMTGEMRALTDPVHREICKKLFDRHKSKFDMIFYYPSKYEISGQNIAKYNREVWEDISWSDHFQIFDLLGDGIVNLYALPTLKKIHYSVFDDKYILLQSHHDHMEHIKEVWILESKFLNKKLLDNAKDLIKKAEYLQPILFRRFNLSISSDIALHTLFMIEDEGKIKREKLLSSLEKVKWCDKSIIPNLIIMGLVQVTNDFFTLTEEGNKFLKLLT